MDSGGGRKFGLGWGGVVSEKEMNCVITGYGIRSRLCITTLNFKVMCKQLLLF